MTNFSQELLQNLNKSCGNIKEKMGNERKTARALSANEDLPFKQNAVKLFCKEFFKKGSP